MPFPPVTLSPARERLLRDGAGALRPLVSTGIAEQQAAVSA